MILKFRKCNFDQLSLDAAELYQYLFTLSAGKPTVMGGDYAEWEGHDALPLSFHNEKRIRDATNELIITKAIELRPIWGF